MIVAIFALVLAIGGFAVAAIPEKNGTIHGCYKSSGGNLRVVSTAKCPAGEKSLSWNQGVARVTVRPATLTVAYTTCTAFGTASYQCSGTGTRVAQCNLGERATGGGWGRGTSDPTESEQVKVNRPAPPSGTPTGWLLTVTSYVISSSPSHPDLHLPIFAVCAV
jgi:hypothetical protein